MENTKSLRQQLAEKQRAIEAAQKEIKAIEHKMKLEGVKTTLDAMTAVISNDETVLEKLCDFTPEEARIIGRRIVKNFPIMIEKSMDDIKSYREKKAARDAKRKAKQAEKQTDKSGEQTVTKSANEQAKPAEQKPVTNASQTSAPQVQQNAQQPVQRPVQSSAQTAQQTQQKPVPGNVMYGSQGASQTQSGNGVRYTPDGGR